MDATQRIVRVGLSGLGRSGWCIHADCLKRMTDRFDVRAAFDPISARCDEAAALFGCTAHGSFEELVADDSIEAVIVASPSHLHARQSIQALEAGKHVVCEKPMATRLADADEMIQVANRTQKSLAVFQCCRYDADFLKVKEIMDSGALGRIVQIKMCWHGFGRRWDWQTSQQAGGGALNNTGPHMMDLALQLIHNKAPSRVTCQMDRALSSGDAEDHVTIMIETQGEPALQLEISSCCAYPAAAWLVMGTLGTLTGSRNSLEWKRLDPATLPERPLNLNSTTDRGYNDEPLDWIEGHWGEQDSKAQAYSSAAAALGKGGPFYMDLHAHLVEGKPFPIALNSVRLQMAIFEECHRQCAFWGTS